MGMFDSIGLGSITKALDIGNTVKGVVDGMLPKEMGFIGDIAGAVVDLKTGNLAGALKLGMDALRDLPQTQTSARGTQPGAATNASTNHGTLPSSLEPSPPSLASRQGKEFDWNDLLSAMKALTAALNGKGAPPAASPAAKPADGSAPAPEAGTAGTSRTQTHRSVVDVATAFASHLPPAAPTPNQTANQTTWRGQAQAPASTADQSSWRGQPQAAPNHAASPGRASATASTPSATASTAPAPSATAPAATTAAAPSTAKPDAKPATSTTPTTNTTTPAAANKGQTITSVAQLGSMSDAAIQDAVTNGRISPDLLKDPGAVMAIQQRMNAITEMNNLMTAMMRAIHDMQMAIVQNIRI